MSRLTTNNEVSKMGMYELALNSCYIKDGLTRYRDFTRDIDARDFARYLMASFGEWKENGDDMDNEIVDDDVFDDTMLDNLSYTPNTIKGLIALFYRNLWAMADLRETLKEYEDAEEQGLLLKLPCKVGDTVYRIVSQRDNFTDQTYKIVLSVGFKLDMVDKIGKYVFLTKEEAEKKLKEMERDTNGN